jgi:hypothetical protein
VIRTLRRLPVVATRRPGVAPAKRSFRLSLYQPGVTTSVTPLKIFQIYFRATDRRFLGAPWSPTPASEWLAAHCITGPSRYPSRPIGREMLLSMVAGHLVHPSRSDETTSSVAHAYGSHQVKRTPVPQNKCDCTTATAYGGEQAGRDKGSGARRVHRPNSRSRFHGFREHAVVAFALSGRETGATALCLRVGFIAGTRPQK